MTTTTTTTHRQHLKTLLYLYWIDVCSICRVFCCLLHTAIHLYCFIFMRLSMFYFRMGALIWQERLDRLQFHSVHWQTKVLHETHRQLFFPIYSKWNVYMIKWWWKPPKTHIVLLSRSINSIYRDKLPSSQFEFGPKTEGWREW